MSRMWKRKGVAMKQIIMVEKIKSCGECRYSHGDGIGGFWGNRNAGGCSARCGKTHKTITKHLWGHGTGTSQTRDDAEKAFDRDLSKIADWCPLDDYKKVGTQR